MVLPGIASTVIIISLSFLLPNFILLLLLLFILSIHILFHHPL